VTGAAHGRRSQPVGLLLAAACSGLGVTLVLLGHPHPEALLPFWVPLPKSAADCAHDRLCFERGGQGLAPSWPWESTARPGPARVTATAAPTGGSDDTSETSSGISAQSAAAAAGGPRGAAMVGHGYHPSLSGLVGRLARSVVNVSALQQARRTGTRPAGDRNDAPAPRNLGAGFILDASGLVATSHHVIRDAHEIYVQLHDGSEHPARVLGVDPRSDLALLKMVRPPPHLSAVAVGDSDRLAVGDWVIAMGNPFGLSLSVSVGVLSAKGRPVGPGDDYLQTDASINPGNSGGPLFDMNGKVVGISSATVQGGQGIGFAIPINPAMDVLRALRDHGRVVRSWLGVDVQEQSRELAQALGLTEPRGALVSSVAHGGPAARGGVHPGDVILAVDGRRVQNASQLPRVLVLVPPGKPVRLSLWRRQGLASTHVTMMELREVPASGRPQRPVVVYGNPLGLSAREQTIEERRAWQQGEPPLQGVVVTDVDPEGPTAGKLEAGDVILEVDHHAVPHLPDLRQRLAATLAAHSRSPGSRAAPTAPAYAVVRFQRGDGRFYTAVGLIHATPPTAASAGATGAAASPGAGGPKVIHP
jgi:serine protease Do